LTFGAASQEKGKIHTQREKVSKHQLKSINKQKE
jgi:hypothetical protein